MAKVSPAVAEQMHVLRRIIENGFRSQEQKPEDKSRRLDDWVHLHDEFRFLVHLMRQ